MDALGAWRVDEDLERGPRVREPAELGGVELERDVRLGLGAVVAPLEEVGPQHRAHHGEEAPQDLVLVEALDRVDRLLDAADDRLRGRIVRLVRVEAGAEQVDQHRGDVRVGDEHLLDVAVAEGRAGLAQIARDPAQHRHLAPGQAGAQDEPVVAVVLDLAAPGPDEGLAETLAHAGCVGVGVAAPDEAEVVDPDALGVARPDRVGALVRHLHAHVLEQRQHVRQRDRPARAVELRAQHARRRLERPVQADLEPAVLGQLLDVAEVGECRAGHPVGPVGGREGVAVAAEELLAALLALVLDERLLEVVDPRARRSHQHQLDRARVDAGAPPRLRVCHVVEPDEHRLGDARRVVEALGVGHVAQDRLDAAPVLGVETVARDEHETRVETPEAIAPDEQAQPLALAEMEDPHRRLEQLVRGNLDQLVARVRLEDLDQRLLVMAPVREGGSREYRADLAAQDRHRLRPRLIGGVRVEAEEAPLADHAALLVEALDADVVEVGGTVDRGA